MSLTNDIPELTPPLFAHLTSVDVTLDMDEIDGGFKDRQQERTAALSRSYLNALCTFDPYTLTCSVIWGLLDKDDDLRASHELLNTERIL